MGTNNQSLPPYVMIPGNSEQAAETRTGFLPKSLSVFKTGGRDLSNHDWEVGDLLARVDNSGSRLKIMQRPSMKNSASIDQGRCLHLPTGPSISDISDSRSPSCSESAQQSLGVWFH